MLRNLPIQVVAGEGQHLAAVKYGYMVTEIDVNTKLNATKRLTYMFLIRCYLRDSNYAILQYCSR